MKHANVTVLSASDATSQTGTKIDSVELFKASFQASFADTSAAGTLVVQVSNDIPGAGYLPNTFTPTHWTTLTTTSVTVTAGASVVIPAIDLSYRWLRILYTSTAAGTSTMTVNMFALAL